MSSSRSGLYEHKGWSVVIGLLLLCLFSPEATAQYPDYVRHHAEILSADSMSGRGYVDDGLEMAQEHIAAEFRALGLRPLGEDHLQYFFHPINYFPGSMSIKANGRELTPGVDFLVDPAMPFMKGKYKVKQFGPGDKMVDPQSKRFRKWCTRKNVLLVFDYRGQGSEVSRAELDAARRAVGGQISTATSSDSKLTWGASTRTAYQHHLSFHGKALEGVKELRVNIEARQSESFRSANVIGYIPGSERPDSFMVFTAHYDHLGKMGENTIFNGANDNASGTAVMMSLAKHYMEHPPKYSCLFIAFAGEEAGLLGSRYFVERPLIPLEKMRFLINLDLFASGVEGVTVVNATAVPDAFALMVDINDEQDLLPLVKERGPAANSDHHFFAEAGVPAVFIYALGGDPAYHDIHDTFDKLTFAEYEDIFRLIVAFVERYGTD